MRPPRFAQDEAQLDALGRQAKAWVCPHCGEAGTVNRHGSLRGCGEGQAGKQAERGRRFFCSNRGQRDGCGRTFSILLSQMIGGATVRSRELWRFYRAKFSGQSALAAWASLRSGFSVEAAYGWWRRWSRGQCALRAWLCRGRAPPVGSVADALAAVFGADDPIAGFQASAQRDWPK
jgi:hypothetical protein